MPSNKKKAPNSEPTYGGGDRVKVNLHTGRIVDATVKAVIERTGGRRLQVEGRDRARSSLAGSREGPLKATAFAHIAYVCLQQVELRPFAQRMRSVSVIRRSWRKIVPHP